MAGGDRRQERQGQHPRKVTSLFGHNQAPGAAKFVPRSTLSVRGEAAREALMERQSFEPTPSTTSTVPPPSSSAIRLMVKDILGALGLETVSSGKTAGPSLSVIYIDKFAKFSYLFDISSAAASRLLPQIITHGTMASKLGEDTVPAREFSLIRDLLLQRPLHPKIDESTVDIFEDAGTDYQFRPKTSEDEPSGNPVLGTNPIEFASLREGRINTTSIIPESVESIIQTVTSPAEGSSGERDAAYLIMGYDYNDGGDDDEDGDGFFSSATASRTATLSKRQKLRRDAQKLDKQVRQVTKLMEESSSKHEGK